MAGASYDPKVMEAICMRIHNGEHKTKIAAETNISTGTILKWYRIWCRTNNFQENSPFASILQKYTQEGAVDPITPKPKINIPPPKLDTLHTVLVIPDMHHPFVHQDALAFLQAVQKAKQTTLAVCLGDEIDAASFSRYLPDPDGMSPGTELKKAVESLLPFYIAFPEMLVCESNHTVRPFKKAFEAGLPAAFLPSYATLLKAPDGWRWASRWSINNVLYIHGDNGKSGAYAHINYMKAAKQSVVIGHIHSYAGVNYEAQYFAVNSGCLVDETAYCFKYARNMIIKVNLGCSVVYEGKYAEFIPMRLDGNGRWIGKL